LWRYNRAVGLADSISAIKKAIEAWPEFRDNLDLPDTMRLRKALIEGKANGKSAVAVLEAMPVIGKLIESIPVQGETKGQRANAHKYTIQGGHLYLPPKQSPYEWVDREWLPLVCGFPRKRHDEDVDCTTQALLWFAQNKPSGFHCG
jgi:phage terminase large subunit-like protein